METKTSINKKIKHLMVENNLNQTTLSQAAKMDRVTLCLLLSGKRRWTYTQAYRVIKIFPELCYEDFGLID